MRRNAPSLFNTSKIDALRFANTSDKNAINLDPKSASPKFYLGTLMGRQGKQEEAITLWKQGLDLFDDKSQYDRLRQALYQVGIGEIERGTNSLRKILETEKPLRNHRRFLRNRIKPLSMGTTTTPRNLLTSESG